MALLDRQVVKEGRSAIAHIHDMYRYSRGRNLKKIYYLQGGGLCFTERLSESLSVCLLATSHRNYRTDLHENFIKDVSLDKENNINFGNHPRLDHKNPKNEKKTLTVEQVR